MAIYRGPGGPGDAVADAASEAALISALVTQAQTAETNAGNSASAAGVSATNAANSASTASTAATNATNSATSAAASLAAIGSSEANAAASASAAATSATNAANSATSAGSSATSATASASAASSSASAASTSASNAASSASAASTSASNAASSASTASTAATNAANSATAAATSESNASTSATNAANSASSATTSASNAATSASQASTAAGQASASASNAATSETNAQAYELSANEWATKTSGPVAGGEYSAKYHAQAAATSATSASNSATAAANSYDAFDDRYLGSKSSPPTLDNDGNALLTGALYWNTSSNQLFVWDGAAWNQAAFSVSGSVTSVGMTVPIGLTVTGSPITTAGTLAVSYSSGYTIPTTAKQTEWDTAYSWGNHATSGYLTSAAIGTTVQSYDADTAKLDVAQTWAANQNFADYFVQRATLKDYAVEGSVVGNTGSTETFDLTNANFFSATLDQACTFTFSNPPASGDFGTFVLELTNGGAFTITWPASVDWPGGTAPTLTASGKDQLVFTTRDGGTTWFGFVAGKDIK